MKRMKWLIGIAMTAAIAWAPSMTADAALKEEEKWLIKYNEPQTRTVLSTYAQNYDLHIDGQFVTVPKSELSNQEIQKLRESGEVAYIEPVRTRQALGLENSKELWDYKALELDTIATQAAEAKEVLVAVVDTGVEAEHPYLSDIVVEGYDTINDESHLIDMEGHGTHVAGIVKRATEGFPIKILPVRVLNEYGFGESVDIAEGVIYAADQGADIINMSLGGLEITQVEQDAIAYAQEKGALVIVAAGNDASDVHTMFPANIPSVLTIGAVGQEEEELVLAPFSNHGTLIDLVAPGVGILSAYPEALDTSDDERDGYTELDGTSMATPFASGVAAIVKSVYPTLTNDQIEMLLKKHAKDLFAEGFDKEAGFGHVSLAAFNPENKVLQLRTMEANESTTQLEIGTNGYATGTLQVTIGEETFKTDFSGNGYHAVPVTIPEAFKGADMTIALLQDGKVVEQLLQKLYVAPVEIPLDIVNQKGRYPSELTLEVYGLVDGELEYITSNYWFEVEEELTMLMPDVSDYEQVWAFIVADKAAYTLDITGQETITTNHRSLIPATFKNSFTLIHEETKSYDPTTYFELYPMLEGAKSNKYFSFSSENSRETYYVQPGLYDLVAYDYNSPAAMVKATGLEVKEKYTFDVIDYTDVVSVEIDWSNFNFEQDDMSMLMIKDETNHGIGRPVEIGELEQLVLSPGTYTFTFTQFDMETFEEETLFEETFELISSKKITIEGDLTANPVDITTTVEEATHNFMPYPGLPLGDWTPFKLDRTIHLPRKPWIVTFSQPVNADTVEGNIYIVDDRGVPIDVNFTFSNSFKALQILPQQQYRPGTYHIYIDGKVEAVSGKALGKGIHATFTY